MAKHQPHLTSELPQSDLSLPVAFILLLMGASAMGISPVFVRLAEVGPFASAFWRVFLALPILFIWAYLETKKSGRTIRWKLDKPILLAGIFFSGDLIFWHLAIMKTTMANATLMATLAPVWVVLFSRAFIGEEVSKKTYFGLIFCLAGAALLIGSSFRVAPDRIVGDIFGFVTSIFFGLYFLAIRVARRSRKGGEVTFLTTIITSLVLFIVAIAAADKMIPDTITGASSLAALGIVSHAGGQGLLAVALGSLSAAFSSLVIFVEAIVAAIFGWAVFQEKLGPLQLLGGSLILFGVWYARPRSDKIPDKTSKN
jgi:drug/metabolite transporter (DMT)-like permease